MAAITWRNVSGPSEVDALRALQQAGMGISGAFGDLRGVVRDVELADKANQDVLRERNTQTFLDNLYSNYKTPEALQAAISSGEIDAQRAAFGNNINRAATRGAADTRLAAQQSQAIQSNQFQDQVRDRAEHELIQKGMAHVAQGGKFADVADTLKGVRNYGDVSKMFNEAERGNIRFGWDEKGQEMKVESHADALKTSDVNRARMRNAMANENARTAIAREAQAGVSADRREGQELSKLYGQAGAAYQQQLGQSKAALNQLASENPMLAPRDKTGNIAIDRMTPDQKAVFNDLAVKKGIPTLDVLEGGDTAAANAIRQAALQSGRFRPETIARADVGLPVAFDTTGLGAIGSDAAAKAKAKLKQAALDEEGEMKFGTVGTVKDLEKYTDAAQKGLAHLDPKLRTEYMPIVMKYLNTGGIKGKETDDIRVLPSPAQFKTLLMQTDPSVFESRSDEVLSNFRKWEKDNLKDATEAFKRQVNQRTRSVRDAGSK